MAVKLPLLLEFGTKVLTYFFKHAAAKASNQNYFHSKVAPSSYAILACVFLLFVIIMCWVKETLNNIN